MMDFYSLLATYYEKIFPLDDDTVDFVISFINHDPSVILDIGCATGGLSQALAQKGHHVTGIDLNETMIQRAEERAFIENISVRFLVLDMLFITTVYKTASFDTIICFGNTLVHITNLSTIEDFLGKVYALLAPGGVFILQILHYNFILREHIASLPLIDTTHVRFERYYDYSNEKTLITFQAMLTDKNSNHTYQSSTLLYPLTRQTLDYLLKKNGFVNVAYFRDMQKKTLEENSLSLIAVAYKA